jgi:hypothetical protein
VLLTLGAIGLVVYGYLCLGFEASLDQVDPSQLGHGVTYHGSGMDRLWILIVLITSVTMVFVTGLPMAGLRSGRGSLRGAIAQGIGGAVIACWTAGMSVLLSAFYFMGPDDRCTYPSCWPLHEQQAAFVVPGVLTGLAMFVMALLVNKLPWVARALTPVILWITALVLQQWVWTTYLTEIFEGPPR